MAAQDAARPEADLRFYFYNLIFFSEQRQFLTNLFKGVFDAVHVPGDRMVDKRSLCQNINFLAEKT